MNNNQSDLLTNDSRHFISDILLGLTKYETLPVHYKHHKQAKHVEPDSRKSPLCMGVNFRFLFVNATICALICLTMQTGWGVTLFVVIHLLVVRFSLNEPDFLHLDSKSFIKTMPMFNRWGYG